MDGWAWARNMGAMQYQPCNGNGIFFGENLITRTIDCEEGKVRLMIGKCGSTINSIRATSQCNIQLDLNAPPGISRKVILTGTPSQVAAAEKLVLSVIGEKLVTPSVITRIINCEVGKVGLIIGKGGSTINSLRASSHCNIEVDLNAVASPGVPRKVILTGTPSQVAAAERLVLNVIGEMLVNPSCITRTIDCEERKIGLIIGKSGNTIDSLRKTSQCRINIDENFSPGVPRKIILSGTPSQVAGAEKLILGVLKDGSPEIGISGQKLGNPAPCTPKLISKIIYCEQGQVGRIFGKGGSTIKYLNETSHCDIRVDQNVPAGVPRRIIVTGTPSQAAAAEILVLSVLKNGPPEIGPPGENSTTKNVSCPQNVIGRLIGKNGETIRQLQVKSGATIWVDDMIEELFALPSGKKYHTFLSHRKKKPDEDIDDSELFATLIKECLRAKHFNVFLDMDDLLVITEESLRVKVLQSCTMIIIVDAKVTESAWCKKEWKWAQTNAIPIFPVYNGDRCTLDQFRESVNKMYAVGCDLKNQALQYGSGGSSRCIFFDQLEKRLKDVCQVQTRKVIVSGNPTAVAAGVLLVQEVVQGQTFHGTTMSPPSLKRFNAHTPHVPQQPQRSNKRSKISSYP